MIAWIKRHKILTALIITLVALVLVGVAETMGANVDVGGLSEVAGLGWSIYGFAWLIWEYPKWRAKRRRSKESTD